MTRTTTTTWRSATASSRGATHVEIGLANEDHARTADRDGVVVAAVADGHGAARFPRAARAARCATRAATDVLPALLADGATDAAVAAVPEALVTRWRELVDADRLARPTLDDGDRAVRRHYGTTLLAAAAVGDRLVLAQLGDGDVLLVDEDGVRSPVPAPEWRTVLRSTDTMVASDADARVRVVTVALDEGRPRVVLLASDGLEAAVSGSRWREDLGVAVLAELRDAGAAGLDDVVATWCERWAATGGDDATVALLVDPSLLR